MKADCDVDRLGDYVDGTMSPSDRSRLELHLAGCDVCQGLLGDLLRIRKTAARLPRLVPREELWQRIEVSLPSPGGHSRLPWRFASSRMALAASVALLIGVYSLLMWWTRTPTGPGESSTQLTDYAVSELVQAEKHYSNAISALEKVVDKERKQKALDPQLMAVLSQNLEIIERAIGESRAAAQREPENPVARQTLLEALRVKLSLLERTVLLINEIRKGRGESAYDLLSEIRDESQSN